MTTEDNTRPVKPVRISRRMSFWLWRSAIALLCLAILIASVIAFRGRTLQTFVSKTDPKTGYRFSFQLSKRWQLKPSFVPPLPPDSGMFEVEEFHPAPTQGLAKWLDKWVYHSKPSASPNDHVLGFLALSDLSPFGGDSEGYPYLKSHLGYTIISDRRMILSGGKAYFCHMRLPKPGSQFYVDILLVKVNDTPLFCYLAGINDSEVRDHFMSSDFDTIIRTFKVEQDAKARKERK